MREEQRFHVYHVAKTGSDCAEGTAQHPFLTVQRAAEIARAGDRVVVHAGTYREWVKPVNGGTGDDCRITYEAAAGEAVVLKGSERVQGWKREKGSVWSARVSNALFGCDNPFSKKMTGDWLVDPKTYDVHLGAVYLNGTALYEARSEEELSAPVLRTKSELSTWGGRPEETLRPEESLLTWRAEVSESETMIYANFGVADPNAELVEINVRPCCFYPDRSGVNYITLRGFEIAQAATPWAPPTSNQIGMVGPNWAKGWIIEENNLHDSKCSAISLGKDGSTGDNEYTYTQKKPDYLYQMEAVCKALSKGWSKEQVGSHIVRNNTISDCGQAGIVGHMGCIFSKIYGNDIFRIATRHEFWGHEIAGIKFHAGVDAEIFHNHIHHCSLGTWLDWQAQGVRLSGNVYDHNARDLMVEVTHGPYLVDNNIFASPYNFDNAAEGGAYVHNLCCGLTNHYQCLDRPTPYHLPHSTQLMGVIWTAGMDDRWYQNIFVGGAEEGRHYGTTSYNGSSLTMEEYVARVNEYRSGDYLEGYRRAIQPVAIHRNTYLQGAKPFEKEADAIPVPACTPKASVEDVDGVPTLHITLPQGFSSGENEIITTALLGTPRITEAGFERTDGSPLAVDCDILLQKRNSCPTAGPIESLKAGENIVCLGQFGAQHVRARSGRQQAEAQRG